MGIHDSGPLRRALGEAQPVLTDDLLDNFFPSEPLQSSEMVRGKDIEEILRGVTHSRCVGVEITNKTAVNLRSPRFGVCPLHLFLMGSFRCFQYK